MKLYSLIIFLTFYNIPLIKSIGNDLLLDKNNKIINKHIANNDSTFELINKDLSKNQENNQDLTQSNKDLFKYNNLDYFGNIPNLFESFTQNPFNSELPFDNYDIFGNINEEIFENLNKESPLNNQPELLQSSTVHINNEEKDQNNGKVQVENQNFDKNIENQNLRGTKELNENQNIENSEIIQLEECQDNFNINEVEINNINNIEEAEESLISFTNQQISTKNPSSSSNKANNSFKNIFVENNENKYKKCLETLKLTKKFREKAEYIKVVNNKYYCIACKRKVR
ncbi:hypothetical protein ACQ4LE_010911 [Meloidogyne hapla]